jgi:hypothetical protein
MSVGLTLCLPPHVPLSATSTAADLLNAEDAAACATEGLDALLSLSEQQFLDATSSTDVGLGTFLNTFLRFAPRRFELKQNAAATVDTADVPIGLRRRVLLVLLRLSTPPLREADSEKWRERVGRLVSAPLLLDLYALYGFSDGAVCERITVAFLRATPRLGLDLHGALGGAAVNLARACGYSSGDGTGGAAAARQAFSVPCALEVSSAEDVKALAHLLLDACGSMHALLLACPPSALRALGPTTDPADSVAAMGCAVGIVVDGASGLLAALQMVAEAALPQLRRANAAGARDAAVSDALAAAGIHCVHAASLLVLKTLATGEGGRALELEELMAALLQLHDPCEMMPSVSAACYERANVPMDAAASRAAPGSLVSGCGALLQQMLHLSDFGARVERALEGAPAANAEAILPLLHRPPSRESAAVSAAGGSATASASGGGAGAGITEVEREKARMLADVMPGCGVGFLVAVLRAYGGNPEPALNAILEGSLPAAIDALPRSLAMPPPSLADDAGGSKGGGGGGGGDVPGGGRRKKDTLSKRREREEERKVLADVDAPGRRAPKAALEAATEDDFSGALALLSERAEQASNALLYEDEFDDSLEAFAGDASSSTAPSIFAEDPEEAASLVRKGGTANRGFAPPSTSESAPPGRGAAPGGGGGGGPGGGGSGLLPHNLPQNAIEWVRSIGLGQYAEKMRAAGLLRLELAAVLTATELDRIGATPAHRTKLLASSSRLAARLKERGRTLPGGGGGGGGGAEPVYAAAAQIHYDAESGTFWSEDGSVDHGADASGAASGVQQPHATGPVPSSAGRTGRGRGRGRGRGQGQPLPEAAQRARNTANKAKVANHSRKAAAARKQQL